MGNELRIRGQEWVMVAEGTGREKGKLPVR